jgi:hypothetical protein
MPIPSTNMNRPLARLMSAVALMACGLVLTPGVALAATATVTVDSEWSTGYTAQLTVRNTESTPLTTWSIEFDLPAGTSVRSAWGATFTHAGGHWTGKAAYWNATVPAGGSVTAGFVAAGTARPTGCLLNGSPCDGTAPAPDITPPSTPGRLIPLPTPFGQFGFGWTPSTDDRGVVRYEVFANNQKIAETTGTSFVQPTPPPMLWVYGVRAVDAAGNVSPFSTYTLGWPADTMPPSTPANLRLGASGVPGYLAASWDASTDNITIAGYEVAVNGVISRTSATRLLFPFTIPGVYTVRVRAYDGGGNFSPAAAIGIAIDPTPPPPAPR